jgi:hypothetical protein
MVRKELEIGLPLVDKDHASTSPADVKDLLNNDGGTDRRKGRMKGGRKRERAAPGLENRLGRRKRFLNCDREGVKLTGQGTKIEKDGELIQSESNVVVLLGGRGRRQTQCSSSQGRRGAATMAPPIFVVLCREGQQQRLGISVGMVRLLVTASMAMMVLLVLALLMGGQGSAARTDRGTRGDMTASSVVVLLFAFAWGCVWGGGGGGGGGGRRGGNQGLDCHLK